MSNIVLATLTYVGRGITNGTSLFLEQSAGVVAGFRRLTSRVTFNDKTVVAWKLELPTLVEDDSPCGCAGAVKYINYVDITFRSDRKTTAAERTAVLTSIQNLVASTQFGTSITDLVNPT